MDGDPSLPDSYGVRTRMTRSNRPHVTRRWRVYCDATRIAATTIAGLDAAL